VLGTKDMTTYLKLFSLSGDIYIIFNLDMYPMISHNEVMASAEHAQVCWEQKA
jgi:hypothetical protein